MNQNIVTINGKRYDAKTGRLLDNSTPKPTVAKKTVGVSMDGIARHTTGAHVIHAKPEKSKTLMRSSVKKPASTKIHAKTSVVNTPAAKQNFNDKKLTDAERSQRAHSTPKSPLISRFGKSSVLDQPAAKHQPVAHLPVKQAPAHTLVKSDFRPNQAHKNPFESMIANANSHAMPSIAKKTKRHKIAKALRISPRAVSMSSFVLAGLLLGGFFVYQNIPNMAMKLASTRSGVSASLPDYKPAGFVMSGPIQYSAGKISVNYHSNTDDRAYEVTQSASEWNPDSLLDNYVATNNRSYQTFQDRGRTIYIYEDSNATWVNKGVWYKIEGKSALNSDQLLRIANSL